MKRVARILSWVALWVLQPLLVVAVLAGGFLGAKKLAGMRAATPEASDVEYAPLVRAVPVHVERVPVSVRGHGTVRALNPMRVVAQVGGRVVHVHEGLRAGGRVGAGETLVAIEKDDFVLARARARADLAAAEAARKIVQAEAETARAEWDRLNPGTPVPAMVAREPQLAEADARVATAEARLKEAELGLKRTTIALPVGGRVLTESVDVGQVVAPNQLLATLYDPGDLEVPVPVEADELRWIELPGENGDAPGGSRATVSCRLGGEPVELPGRVVRLMGEMDEASRLVHVVVRLSLDGLTPGQRARILPGLFVDVAMAGGALDGVARLPRAAVRDDGVVWVVRDGRLVFVRPEVVRAHGAGLLVRGLADGALVVRSDLEVVTDGMKVRLAEEAR